MSNLQPKEYDLSGYYNMVLRLEVGIPFIVLNLPWAWFVGLIYVGLNSKVERDRNSNDSFLKEARIILLSILLNFIVLGVSFVIQEILTPDYRGRTFFEEWTVLGLLVTSAFILTYMIFSRFLFLMLDRSPWKWLK